MRSCAPRTRGVVLAAAMLTPGALEAGDAALLPDVSLHLEAARYAPTETAFKWDGWISGGVGLLRVDGVTLYGSADIETIIGSEKRAFDANQANYHLETGLRCAVGRGDVALVFHHVSRHYVDRPKTQAVDWNLLGLRATGPFPEAFRVPGRFSVSVGHTTLASLVGYRWEATLRAEADLLTRPWGTAYLVGDARLVTREVSALFPEKRFVDVRVEAGLRFTRGARALRAFVAYERRNDVLLEMPGVRDRALVGLRVGFGDPGGGAQPTSSPRPSAVSP